MTTAATATCPAWCRGHEDPGGPHCSPEVLLDTATGVYLMAQLEVAADRADTPAVVLQVEDNLPSDHRLDPAAAEQFAAELAVFVRHLAMLTAVAADADRAVSSVLPAVLARAEANWWAQQDVERAANYATAETAGMRSRRPRRLAAVHSAGSDTRGYSASVSAGPYRREES
jgi:hypothetical protein